MAIKVLGRRKFFTFISLFGISITLMVMTIISSFIDSEVGKNAPVSKRDQIVFLPELSMILMVKDTIWSVDSTEIDGIMHYDSSFTLQDNDRSVSTSALGYRYLEDNLRNVAGAQLISFYSPGHTDDLFRGDQKLTLSTIYTDENYWRIFDFKIIQGRSYSNQEIENSTPVTLLSRTAAKRYFGTDTDVLEKEVQIDNKYYKVIGLLEDVPASKYFLSADLYLPLTLMREEALTNPDFLGSFEAAFLTDSKAKADILKAEIKHSAESVPLRNPEEYNTLKAQPRSLIEGYAQELLYFEDAGRSVAIVFSIIAGFLLLFILLPTLNLININVTRIMERSSEIGVRKAFGASNYHLFRQFIFENLVLTFIGGFIGLGLAIVAIRVINNAGVLEETVLVFNSKVFIISFVVCLVFGFLSGYIPALRMSRMQIVNALNHQL